MERYFKKNVVELKGYKAPPQVDFQVKLNQNESPFDIPFSLKKELAEEAIRLPWNRYPCE